MKSLALQEIDFVFEGVVLGAGMSLRQAELVDDMSYTEDHRWEEARVRDVTEDWRKVPARDIEDLCYLAHLDAEGFRYYIPAMLSRLAEDYDPSWPNVIQVFSALQPKEESWEYHMHRYSLLSLPQKRAIAHFLVELPAMVQLRSDDSEKVTCALRSYWGRFLDAKKAPNQAPDPTAPSGRGSA